MARKNSSSKNKSRRTQGRPVGYVPPRLVDVQRKFEGDGVRLRTMRETVEYLELMDRQNGFKGKSRLTALPLYRMTANAYEEAINELSDLSWTIDDLPHARGAIAIEGHSLVAGFIWWITTAGKFRTALLPRDSQFDEYAFQRIAPSMTPIIFAVLARIIIGGTREVAPVRSLDNNSSLSSSHGRQPHDNRRYEVRSQAECPTTVGPRGSHTGWRLQHESHTRGFFRKNGTWVEGYTRGKGLPKRRPTIVGTTVRAAA